MGGGGEFVSSIFDLSIPLLCFLFFLGDGLLLDGNSQRSVKHTSHSGKLTPKLLNLTGFWNIFEI